jgi:hypothetical protein
MKARTDDYHDCLIVWETIWAATALSTLKAEKEKERSSVRKSASPKPMDNSRKVNNGTNPFLETSASTTSNGGIGETSDGGVQNDSGSSSTSTGHASQERLSDSPKSQTGSSMEKLPDVQLFVLCICLSIIRRERDLIMARQYDACETLKHFNTLHLNDSLNNILQHASTIWYWLKHDGGEEQLYTPEVVLTTEEKRHDSAGEDFDLLSDDLMLVNMSV